ncbi:type II toxin-antitoxin system VapC family toxin [Enterovirga aerilata]|uniref:Ribonuclease VapC n=1 Tax=Enterovirga aerilata TaxID=2730920 RepID=A0A849HUZ2_9HYPH|nr:type II toxin-antitoxin system VapC family toxin [Enterovirga sp. DB1703]NNM70922.1 type II toxin-antitoxin system VapC family toxin [Enterovirga sp. DB1703]
MVVDASALVAILLREADAEALLGRIDAAGACATHAISLYEATGAVARVKECSVADAYGEVASLVSALELEVVALKTPEAIGALEAFARYSKGRHPAKLNMGDCFSYAVAKLRGTRLLYKGDDFSQTDLA